MKNYKRAFTFLLVICSILLLVNCKHDPPVSHGTASDPDSLYVGRPYTFTDNSVGGTFAKYRKVSIPAANPETYEGIQLGRMLFFFRSIST